MTTKQKTLFAWIAALALLASCQPKAQDSFAILKKQLDSYSEALDKLEEHSRTELQKDFMACDSMLQYLHPEEMDEAFEQIQLAGAYLAQFKAMYPLMKSRIEYTHTQLDKLKADAETHYLSDSLVTFYLADEAKSVDTMAAQLDYFTDRLAQSKQAFVDFKRKK